MSNRLIAWATATALLVVTIMLVLAVSDLEAERSKRIELGKQLRYQWQEEDLRIKDCIREKSMLWTRLLELSALSPSDSVAEAEQAKIIDLIWNRTIGETPDSLLAVPPKDTFRTIDSVVFKKVMDSLRSSDSSEVTE